MRTRYFCIYITWIYLKYGWSQTNFTARPGVTMDTSTSKDGTIITGTVYCGFEDYFYKVGDTWDDQCQNYVCSLQGILTTSRRKCSSPQANIGGRRCRQQEIKLTDKQACCTEEIFCSALPPYKSGGNFPAKYLCPAGWVEVNTSVDGRHPVCVRYYKDAKAFDEAKQFCRERGAFLINLDDEAVVYPILQDVSYRQMLLPGLADAEDVFWTGLHYDGEVFAWDGDVSNVRQPQLTHYCSESGQRLEGSPYVGIWGCNYLDQWSKLAGDPCVSATIAEREITNRCGQSSYRNITELTLSGCEEKHEFICAGEFNSLSLFKVETNERFCGKGWLWNSFTRLCFKYIKSRNAKPNYFAATDDCTSMGGTLYNSSSEEKRFLLYEIMRTRTVQPYSVWIANGQCQEMINPYIAKVQSLEEVQKVTNCYTANPYVCEKLPSTAEPAHIEARLQLTSGSNDFNYEVTGTAATPSPADFFIIRPSGEILPRTTEQPLGSPVPTDRAGPYRFAVWIEEISDYIYSNVLNVNDDGNIYSMVITIPLKNVSSEGWHNMVAYYAAMRNRGRSADLLSIEDKVSFIAEAAFNQTKNDILNSSLCNSCGSQRVNNETSMSLERIRGIRNYDTGGVVVTADLTFNAPRALQSSVMRQTANPRLVGVTDALGEARRDKSLNSYGRTEWAVLNDYMRQNVIGYLQLDPADAQTVQVLQSGRCSYQVRYIARIDMNITLPATDLYRSIKFSMCGFTGVPIVTATCNSSVGGGADWNLEIEPCDEEMTKSSRKLRQISMTPVTEDNFVTMLKETSELVNLDINVADIAYAAEIMDSVKDPPLLTVHVLDKYFKFFIQTVNNVLCADSEIIQKAQINAGSSVKIMAALEHLVNVHINSTLGGSKDIYQVILPNIAYMLTTDPDITGVMVLKDEFDVESVVYVNSSAPRTVNNNKIVGLFLRDPGLGNIRKEFMAFKSNKLHKSSGALKSVDRIVAAKVAMENGDPVDLSNSFHDLVSMHYPLTIWKVKNASHLKCGFWELHKSKWSESGCDTTIDDVNGVFCSCNHLTDFSVLLDRNRDGTEKEGIHDKILNIITLIGLAISIGALGLVVLTAIMYRRLRKSNSQKVLALLAACLLGLNLTFVIGVEQTESYTGCVVVAIFLHFFLLSSFSWMFVEAILQYLRFVKVLGTYIPRFMLKTSIPAFGIPLVIVCVTLGADHTLYKASDNYCWLKNEALYYSVLLPIGLVLTANMIVFIMVVHGLTCARRRMRVHQSSRAERGMAFLHLKAGVAVFVVLGLTWIFGYLALIEQSSIAFRYLFCVFNSLQGLFIFIFHNIREPSVVKEWQKLFRCANKYDKYASSSALKIRSDSGANGKIKYDEMYFTDAANPQNRTIKRQTTSTSTITISSIVSCTHNDDNLSHVSN